jgi:uncharacterized protein with HEPN domain
VIGFLEKRNHFERIMKNDEKLHLAYHKESITDIREFIAGGRETFMTSKIVQAAVFYKLHTMAESTTHLREELKAKHSEVNWRAIRGFRNVIAHSYLQVRLEEIWKIIENDRIPLKDAVVKMAPELEDNEPS